jgi:hypothetical protein
MSGEREYCIRERLELSAAPGLQNERVSHLTLPHTILISGAQRNFEGVDGIGFVKLVF